MKKIIIVGLMLMISFAFASRVVYAPMGIAAIWGDNATGGNYFQGFTITEDDVVFIRAVKSDVTGYVYYYFEKKEDPQFYQTILGFLSQSMNSIRQTSTPKGDGALRNVGWTSIELSSENGTLVSDPSKEQDDPSKMNKISLIGLHGPNLRNY